MAGFPSLRGRLERRLKITLAGSDLEALVRKRDRRRLRWLGKTSPDPILRFRALRALSELIDPQSEDLFLSIVHAPAGEVTAIELSIAAQALARLVSRQAASPLVRLLEPSRPTAVNLAAARALASLGSANDWAAVRRWVKRSSQHPPFPDGRDLLYDKDTENSEIQSSILVLQVLYPEKDLRWWSSKAKSWLGSADGVPRFASERGADRVVAQSLRTSLSRERLGDDEFRHKVILLGTLARDQDYEYLLGILGSERLDRARAVRSALSLCSDPRGIPHMRQQLDLAKSQSPSELADALRCAGRYAHPELVGPINGSWHGQLNQDCRNNLIWALGECGGGEAAGALVDLVRSRDEQLSDDDFTWIGRSLLRCGPLGKGAVRGGLTIARAGGGERQRMTRLASSMGID
jgi:HEAT repeat protein